MWMRAAPEFDPINDELRWAKTRMIAICALIASLFTNLREADKEWKLCQLSTGSTPFAVDVIVSIHGAIVLATWWNLCLIIAVGSPERRPNSWLRSALALLSTLAIFGTWLSAALVTRRKSAFYQNRPAEFMIDEGSITLYATIVLCACIFMFNEYFGIGKMFSICSVEGKTSFVKSFSDPPTKFPKHYLHCHMAASGLLSVPNGCLINRSGQNRCMFSVAH